MCANSDVQSPLKQRLRLVRKTTSWRTTRASGTSTYLYSRWKENSYVLFVSLPRRNDFAQIIGGTLDAYQMRIP